MEELTAQQREVLYLRFGLEDGKELSLAKIGQRMSLSRERVRHCLLYTSPSPRDLSTSRMPSSA